MSQRIATILILGSICLAVPVRGESIQLNATIVVNVEEAKSWGTAYYTPPSLCLDCRFWGNHRIGGAFVSSSWNKSAVESYENGLSEPVQDAKCYRGLIEGWGSGGYYGNFESTLRCAPCVLGVETWPAGSGSISGAPNGMSSHECGTPITLTASPASGWEFVGWSGAIATTSSTITFTLDASKSMTANFEAIPPPPAGDDVLDGGDGTCNDPRLAGCGGSPILLDIAGQSYRLTSSSDGVLFDLRNEGLKRRIAWTRPGVENAFLALDRDGNGTIDSGAELFGNFTPLRSGQLAQHGFEALRELDENGDAIVDSSDFAWSLLVLWTDRNHDGFSTAGELTPISGSPVVALETNAGVIGRTDPWGNTFRYMAHAHFATGYGESRRAYYDVFLTSTP